MATDQTDTPLYDPQQQKRGGLGCLKGCLIALVVVIVLIVILVVVVWKNWRSWTAMGITQGVQTAMAESGLPDEEKAEVMEQVNRIADAIQDEQLTMEQMGQLGTRLMESPLIPSILVAGVESKYLDESGLSDEEKAETRVTLHRFIQGAMQEQIAQEEVDAVMAHVADLQPDGNWKLRDQVSDDELRAFISDAKTRADAAGVPEEVEEVDPSDELRKIIDGALAEPVDAMAPPMVPVGEE